MINKMLLFRKNKICLESRSYCKSQENDYFIIAAICRDIEQFGFTFDKDLADYLAICCDDLTDFYNELVQGLKELTGANVEYHCLYPNFPEQVREKSSIDLRYNAILHYLAPNVFTQFGEAEQTSPLKYDSKNLTKLTCGDFSDVKELFNNLVSSKTNISAQDKADIQAFIEHNPTDWWCSLPDIIPNKEVAGFISKQLYDYDHFEIIPLYLKTATDVLRFITALSNGDESLATQTHYHKMNRPTRRLIMDCLAACGDTLIEDMFSHRGAWLRIGEIIHPGEFKNQKYDKVREAFSALRNNQATSFSGEIEKLFNENLPAAAVLRLMDRPGEFARKLDRILRTYKNNQMFLRQVINAFNCCANKVSIPVLLQVLEHFKNRNNDDDIRVFFPKGKIAKVYFIDKKRDYIPEQYCQSIRKICRNAIREQLRGRSFLGKVYIDPELKNYIVPFNQRSASFAKIPLTRGSRVSIKQDTKVLRSFIYWTNNKKKRIDVDLSAVLYDRDWNSLDRCSYINLKTQNNEAIHSGDIIDGGPVAGEGVAEFIDLNLEKMEQCGVRYIAFQVNNYTDIKYSEMTNCSFGWMERKDVFSGKVFEPSTVKNRIDLTTDATIACPVIFDLAERQFIWCDMAVKNNEYYPNNVENNLTTTTAVYYAMTNLRKPNLFDLAALNATARGEIVNTKEEADIIFSVNEGITPYDTDIIVSDLL